MSRRCTLSAEESPGTTGAAEQRFRLGARPPVRALAISSVAALVGSVLIVVTVPANWPEWMMVVGGVIMALGVALAATALIATRRLRSVVLLDTDALRVVRSGRTRRIPWPDIESVSLRGPRLVFTLRAGRAVSVVNPPGSPPTVFAALLRAVQQRLDADRGYQPLS